MDGRPARLSGESPPGRGRPTALLLGIQPACSLLEPWAFIRRSLLPAAWTTIQHHHLVGVPSQDPHSQQVSASCLVVDVDGTLPSSAATESRAPRIHSRLPSIVIRKLLEGGQGRSLFQMQAGCGGNGHSRAWDTPFLPPSSSCFLLWDLSLHLFCGQGASRRRAVEDSVVGPVSSQLLSPLSCHVVTIGTLDSSLDFPGC